MRSRTLLILLLSVCLLAPVVANPNGPPWINPINGGLTVETGCTCHGDGVPSNDVVVSISPRRQSEEKFVLELTKIWPAGDR